VSCPAFRGRDFLRRENDESKRTTGEAHRRALE
jgi:hypothetical protein